MADTAEPPLCVADTAEPPLCVADMAAHVSPRGLAWPRSSSRWVTRTMAAMEYTLDAEMPCKIQRGLATLQVSSDEWDTCLVGPFVCGRSARAPLHGAVRSHLRHDIVIKLERSSLPRSSIGLAHRCGRRGPVRDRWQSFAGPQRHVGDDLRSLGLA